MEASPKKSPDREPSPRSPEDPPEDPPEVPPLTDVDSETRLRSSASIENIPRIEILTYQSPAPSNTEGTEVLHTINTEQFPREDQSSSSVLFPLPTNSEDIQNENHLVLTRVLDTSIWEIPTDTTDTTETSSSVIETADQTPLPPAQTEPEATQPEPEDLQEQTQIHSKETETDPIAENPMSEPHCVHIIAEWPTNNTDFEVLSKLDDEYISQEPFLASHQVSGIFDPKDWFIQLSDEDVPPERRLRHNPGQFCLTRGESWTYFEDNEEDYDEPDH